MKHIYATGTLIYHPEPNCTYHFNDPALRTKELLVTFTGDLDEIFCYDITTTKFKKKITDDDFDDTPYAGVFFYPQAYFTHSPTKNLPLIQVYNSQYSKSLISVHHLKLHFQFDEYDDFEIKCKMQYHSSHRRPANTAIKKICRSAVKNIPF